MKAQKIRKLIEAILPRQPESLREERLRVLAEEALVELENILSMANSKTTTTHE